MNLIKPVYAIIENPILKNSKAISSNPQNYVSSAVQTLISVFFIFGLIYFFYHFVLAGYKMIASQGDPKKYEESQHALIYSLIGVGIIFSVFAVLKLVGVIFGITGLEQLKITWPTL